MPSLLTYLQSQYVPYHLGLSANTIYLYGRACRSLQEFHGREIDMTELSDALVLPWLHQRLQQVDPKTARRERGDLLTIWRWAANRGDCPTFPVEIPTIKVSRRPALAWLPEEHAQIVKAATSLKGEMRGTGIPRSLWWSSLLTFLYWVGTRLQATLEIEPNDLNLRQRYVVLRPEVAKTEGQIVRLHEQVIESLMPFWDARRKKVWPYPYNRRQIWPQLKRILRQAGLPADRYHMFHCWRRTTYTLTVRGAGFQAAQNQLGHKTDLSYCYLDTRQLDLPQAADVLPVPDIPKFSATA